jgi:acyl-ACP thioesterase
LIPQPASGRTFTGAARVRLGDVSPKGRVRLDAVARYVQDVANDDAVDAIGEGASAWVVRRTEIHVERFPVFRENLRMTTWASGTGGRWAERRTSLEGDEGGSIEVAALWVHVDGVTGRPKRLSQRFFDVYGEAAGGRTVNSRLAHGAPPDRAAANPWTLRFSDFDVLGHVNNAVYWAVVEECFDLSAPATATVEYRGGIDRGQRVEIVTHGHELWLLADGTVAAWARIDVSTPTRSPAGRS